MSLYEHSSDAIGSQRVQRQPRATIAQFFLRAVQRWQRNRAISQFESMDDRLLADIGISRSDIPRVVEGLFPAEEVASGRVAQPTTLEDRIRQFA